MFVVSTEMNLRTQPISLASGQQSFLRWQEILHEQEKLLLSEEPIKRGAPCPSLNEVLLVHHMSILKPVVKLLVQVGL